MHAEANQRAADDAFEQLLECVITESCKRAKTDVVARALLAFLVRVSNTWLSIRTLEANLPDKDCFGVDAGALIRVLFDAYLQAEYIAVDKTKAPERARDYLDFEHVERYKLQKRVLKYDNWLTRRLRSSPKAATGKEAVQQAFDRVKARFPLGKRKAKRGSQQTQRTRNQWYSGSLPDIAKKLDKLDEYDILLATYHGCVHSSAWAVHNGPPTSPEQAINWASTIATRVARLSVDHNQIELSQLHRKILDMWGKPYLSGDGELRGGPEA